MAFHPSVNLKQIMQRISARMCQSNSCENPWPVRPATLLPLSYSRRQATSPTSRQMGCVKGSTLLTNELQRLACNLHAATPAAGCATYGLPPPARKTR